MPTAAKPARSTEEEDQEAREEAERNRLSDDALVDVEEERKISNSDEVLERLDRELVGLVPVKTRIKGDRRPAGGRPAAPPLRHRVDPAHPAHVLHRQPGHGQDHRGHAHGGAPAQHGLFGPGPPGERHPRRPRRPVHRPPRPRPGRCSSGPWAACCSSTRPTTYLYRAENERDYGQETIEILLQIMENNRDDLVVILAGYKDKMDRFFASNPGMGSRIAHHIHFPDYTLDELMQIAHLMLAEQKYKFSEEAEAAFREYLERRMQQPRFANGRSVRNALERARLRQATRIVSDGSHKLSKDDLMRIEAEDILKSRVFEDYGDRSNPDEDGDSGDG